MSQRIQPSSFSNEDSMMPGLLEFFRKDYNFHVLEEWLESNKSRSNKQSLRLLDWFNTNYSKRYNVSYILKKGNLSRTIYAWDKYNATLSSGYRKGLFDPFGRGKQEGKVIHLELDGKIIEVTLAQLNYFQWAIKNGVIDYVNKHLDAIYEDMCVRNAERKQKKKEKKAALLAKNNDDIQVTVSFNPKVLKSVTA